MAMSADGKIATANRKVTTFGSAHDRRHLLKLRAGAEAIMTGARTTEAENIPQRGKSGRAGRCFRIVVTGSGSVDPGAAIFKKRLSPTIILTTQRARKSTLARLRTLSDEVLVCGEKTVDWTKALPWLRKQWGIQHLLCEGGGELNASLFEAGCVDELHLTICPMVFGGRTAPTIADGAGFPTLAAAAHFTLVSSRCVKGELFLVFRKSRRHHP